MPSPQVDHLQLPPAALRLTSHSCAPATAVGASMHPSLFVGPAGTQSALHADDAGSRFVMALLRGRKRFRIYNASDARCLDPSPLPAGLAYRGTYDADAFGAFGAAAAAAGCVAWEATLGAGELLFIPQQWPHAVLNLEPTIGVSYNFVDEWSHAAFLRYHATRVTAQDPARPRQSARAHLRQLAAQAAALATALEAEGWRYRGEEHKLPEQPLSALVLATFATLEAPPPRAAALPADGGDLEWEAFFRRNRLEHAPGWDGARYGRRVREWLASEAFLSLNASGLDVQW